MSWPDKAVPRAYMLASIKDRASLLQGLLDTDGCVLDRQHNLVRFSNTSPALAAQVCELVRGLGGSAHSVRLTPKNGRPQWQVTVKRLPDWIWPFRLPRKAGMYEAPS